eukprot:TRINITY_DN4430_c0_g1_i2.p1 TRINITY_DN4430_c0_g1~~TRINITY_DN4430_c0_g1_i2.p1  ORF type:complete len:248 (+),score=85.52 TRINITY_DN4430_c0_g1_i2:43-786(+)
MRRLSKAKEGLRVRVFKNGDKYFDYQAGGTEELLSMGGDVQTGEEKNLYRISDNEASLILSSEPQPANSLKLCTIANNFSLMNPEGMWLLTINPESAPSGYSVLPGEERCIENGDILYFGLASKYEVCINSKIPQNSIGLAQNCDQNLIKLLEFDHSKGKDEYTVGSNKDSFIVLEATPDVSETHATIKRIEGYVNEESKIACKSNERFASHEGLFRVNNTAQYGTCLLYTSPSPRDLSTSRMPSSA